MHAGAILVAVLCAALASASVGAEPAAKDHYKGKQIRMIVGHGVGADYDIGGRLLAKHLARHIPGQPTIIVQNMPGAGSTVAANYLFSQAPKDGTVFGSFSRNLAGGDVFPETMVWKLQMAEEKGIIEQALGELANEFELTVDQQTTLISKVLAPMLMLFMGGVVFLMFLACFLPLTQVSPGG